MAAEQKCAKCGMPKSAKGHKGFTGHSFVPRCAKCGKDKGAYVHGAGVPKGEDGHKFVGGGTRWF